MYLIFTSLTGQMCLGTHFSKVGLRLVRINTRGKIPEPAEGKQRRRGRRPSGGMTEWETCGSLGQWRSLSKGLWRPFLSEYGCCLIVGALTIKQQSGSCGGSGCRGTGRLLMGHIISATPNDSRLSFTSKVGLQHWCVSSLLQAGSACPSHCPQEARGTNYRKGGFYYSLLPLGSTWESRQVAALFPLCHQHVHLPVWGGDMLPEYIFQKEGEQQVMMKLYKGSGERWTRCCKAWASLFIQHFLPHS